MNIYVDDVRHLPSNFVGDWRVVRTIEEAKALLLTGDVSAASLDHDMGACADCIRKGLHVGDMMTAASTFMNWCPHHEDGTKLVLWMAETGHWPKQKPFVHSANPVGRERMRGLIDRYFPTENDGR